MHKRSYLTFTLAGMLAAPVAAFAQGAPAPAPGAAAPSTAPARSHSEHRGAMRRTLAALGLSADQKTRIDDIMKSYRASRHSASPETRKQLQTQIEGVLTPDQRTRFAASMQQARSQHRGGPAPEPTPTA